MIEMHDPEYMDARDVDRYVGQRLREKRLCTGLSQANLAHQVNITFQQIQKYERGNNRISAGRLYEFSRVLEEPVAFFFTGLPGQSCTEVSADAQPILPSGPMTRETLEVVRLFFEIQDPRLRKQIKSLLQFLLTYPKG
jgi:transcriptional regulator with XRE-family HTH domain